MRILVFLFICLGFTSWSQDVDLSNSPNTYQINNQIWLKAKAVLPLSKKTEISTQYISRIYLNRSNPGSYFYLSGKHQFKKWISADLTARFVIDQWYNLYRLEAGLKVRKEFKDFKFAFRTAGFGENKTFEFTRDLSRSTFYFWRNRVEVSWSPKKKWEFGASFETWNIFNYHYNGKLDKACVVVDAEYKLSKHHSFTASYQNQFDIQKINKVALNMYSLGYVYTFKKFKKKKKAEGEN